MSERVREQTTGGLGVIRPVRYDPDAGDLDLLDPVPLAALEDAARAVSQQPYLVEADVELGGGWPYTMIVSTRAPDGTRAHYLAAPTRPDLAAATALLEHWTEDLDRPGEWWTDAHQWRELGFTTTEMLAWWQADELPQQARALADLGLTPQDATRLLDTLTMTEQRPGRGLRRYLADQLTHDEQATPAALADPIHAALDRIAVRVPWPVTVDIDLDTGPAAELLARRLTSPVPAVARGAAKTIVALLWRPLGAGGAAFTVPTAWWQTELGRACAEVLGGWWPPEPDPTQLSVSWVMEILRLDRDQVDALLAAGGLTRTEQGRLRITTP